VEIKTLTLSGKQMTLAVFRQLKQELLMGKNGFKGKLWGTVHYCDRDCRGIEHVHVVWQKGPELRRSRIYRINAYIDGDSDSTLSCEEYQALAPRPQLFIAV
jgi:hypothetical protein